MRRSAFESLQRGVKNVLGNWELVLVQLVQSLVVTVLTVAGTLPLVLAVGVGTVRSFFSGGDSGSLPSPEAFVDHLVAAAGPLVLAALAATAVWTVALIVASYFQAGTFGVLTAGDRAAEAADSPLRAFRAFSLGRFKTAAELHVWRFFWLVNVFLLIGLAVTFGLTAGLGAAAWLATSDVPVGALLVGCATILVLFAAVLILSLWWQTSLAVSTAGGGSLWSAVGTSRRILLRRAGALVLLLLVLVAAGMAAFIVFVPAAMILEVAARDALVLYLTGQLVMTLVQWFVSGVMSLVYTGSIIALVVGEPGSRAAEAA